MEFDHLPEFLNSVYEPLCLRAKRLCEHLKEQNILCERGFYNLHAVRRGESFFTEHFPIPVVTAKGLGDFGFELDHVFFEAVLPREKARELDFVELTRDFDAEIYGADNFLFDFYHAGMDASHIHKSIQNSAEKEICVSLRFPSDTTVFDLLGAARRLAAK